MSNVSTEGIPNIQADGWDWFENANSPLKIQREEQTGMTQEDYNVHFRNVFSGKSGEIALNYLASYIQMMPGFDPNAGNDFQMIAANGFYRQGMQDIVQHIYQMANTQPRAKGK